MNTSYSLLLCVMSYITFVKKYNRQTDRQTKVPKYLSESRYPCWNL